MSYRDVKTLSVREQVHQKYSRRAAKLTNVFQCLIVSPDVQRRRMLERAAAEGGWKTYPCGDVSTALANANRWMLHLAVIDLDSQRPETFRPLVEQLAVSRGLLLIVCGREHDVEEEIWARQRGAWMYLPGVADSSDVSLLCGEARQITERLLKSNEREAVPVAAPRESFS